MSDIRGHIGRLTAVFEIETLYKMAPIFFDGDYGFAAVCENRQMAKLLLTEALKRKKMSKRQLAIAMGIDYRRVFSFFRPSFNPTLKTLERLAAAIGVKVTELIRD